MTIKLLLPLLLTMLLLNGCGDDPKEDMEEYQEDVVDTWTQASEADLVRLWGPPQKTYNSGESKFITYVVSETVSQSSSSSSSSTSRPSGRPSNATRGSRPSSTSQPTASTPQKTTTAVVCETTFEIVNNVITSTAVKGDKCRIRTAFPANPNPVEEEEDDEPFWKIW